MGFDVAGVVRVDVYLSGNGMGEGGIAVGDCTTTTTATAADFGGTRPSSTPCRRLLPKIKVVDDIFATRQAEFFLLEKSLHEVEC